MAHKRRVNLPKAKREEVVDFLSLIYFEFRFLVFKSIYKVSSQSLAEPSESAEKTLASFGTAL